MSGPPLLDVRNLRAWIPRGERPIKAVDGMTLTVEEGETLCLVGESGCGKSLTALAIMGLANAAKVEPGSEIRFEGRDLLSLSDREMDAVRGKEISMVFQEPMTALNPVYRVGDQIAEGIRLHTGASRRQARQDAVDILDRVGIPDPAQRARAYPHELSGGMRQRVVIGMAIACRPKLLIADEPTTALDVTVQAEILALLDELQADLGMAILHITHDLAVVAEVADRVAVAYAGRIVEIGHTQQLFSAPAHPYTTALLSAIPRVGVRSDVRLRTIPGVVPPADQWPLGCRFAPRCDRADEQCLAQYPEAVQIEEDHYGVCWHPGGAVADDSEPRMDGVMPRG